MILITILPFVRHYPLGRPCRPAALPTSDKVLARSRLFRPRPLAVPSKAPTRQPPLPPLAANLQPDKPPANSLRPPAHRNRVAVARLPPSPPGDRRPPFFPPHDLSRRETRPSMPPAPEGRDIRPGCAIPRPAAFPPTRARNIIPSGLWNSRPHRHHPPAAPQSGRKRTQPAPGDQPGVRFHNPDYVRCAPSLPRDALLPDARPGETAGGRSLPAGTTPPRRRSRRTSRVPASHLS